MMSREKLKILTPLQELPKTVGDSDQLIVTTGFEKLPKVQTHMRTLTLLTYFIRESITVRPTSCLTCLNFTKHVNLLFVQQRQSK